MTREPNAVSYDVYILEENLGIASKYFNLEAVVLDAREMGVGDISTLPTAPMVALLVAHRSSHEAR